MHSKQRTRRIWTIAIAVAALALIAVILWIDLTTGLWNELVIFSGLAAGFVTFILTVTVLDRVMAKAAEERWAPVTQLALTDFLHAIADEESSEISKGKIVPRTLPKIPKNASDPLKEIHELREKIVSERNQLSHTLSRWSSFLASSGSNEIILRHIAEIALQLDAVRDSALEAEDPEKPGNITALNQQIQTCNSAIFSLEKEIIAKLLKVT